MTLNEKMSFIWHLLFQRKGWLLGCFFSSIFCLFIVYVLPTKHLHYFLGNSVGNKQLCVLVTPEQLLHARQIASLMRAVANNVPWPCKCLAQALSVNWLLKLENIPSVTYLGARLISKEKQAMKAHAWVSVGPAIIIGRSKEQYAVVGTFTSFNTS